MSPRLAARTRASSSLTVSTPLDWMGGMAGRFLFFAGIFGANVYCKGCMVIPYSHRPKRVPALLSPYQSICLVIDSPWNGHIIHTNRICVLAPPEPADLLDNPSTAEGQWPTHRK